MFILEGFTIGNFFVQLLSPQNCQTLILLVILHSLVRLCNMISLQTPSDELVDSDWVRLSVVPHSLTVQPSWEALAGVKGSNRSL